MNVVATNHRHLYHKKYLDSLNLQLLLPLLHSDREEVKSRLIQMIDLTLETILSETI